MCECVCGGGEWFFPGAWVDVKQLLSSHILYRFMWEQDKTGPDVETGTLKGCLEKIKKKSAKNQNCTQFIVISCSDYY